MSMKSKAGLIDAINNALNILNDAIKQESRIQKMTDTQGKSLEDILINFDINSDQSCTRNERLRAIRIIEKIDHQIEFLAMKKRDLMSTYGIIDEQRERVTVESSGRNRDMDYEDLP